MKSCQCKQFRGKIIQSGKITLVHNMEIDAIWGFGEDGFGNNKMGKILMRVSEHLLNETKLSTCQLSWADIV